MGAVLLICLGFDLGWRGYGWRSHLVVAAAIIAAMAIISLFGPLKQAPEILFGAIMMSAFFEVTYILPSWGVGLGARKIFGGGKPYPFQMSSDV